MPLSEHEQRLLEQIERALYAEDPKFASSVRGGRLRRPSRRRRLQGGFLFSLGLILLVAGIAMPFQPGGVPVVSVIGFLVMFGGALLMLSTVGRKAAADVEVQRQQAEQRRGGSLTQRMEERFRKRFEEE
jgi:hypothetical protein